MFWLFVEQQHADKDYVILDGQRLTFRQLGQRAAKAASVFEDVYGVKKGAHICRIVNQDLIENQGDRVAICSRNYLEYLVLFWACRKFPPLVLPYLNVLSDLIGAVSVLVNAWVVLLLFFLAY